MGLGASWRSKEELPNGQNSSLHFQIIWVMFSQIMISKTLPSRGAGGNPPNRFETIHLEPDADFDPEQDPLPRTQFLKDNSSTIIAYNDSPDVGFEASINPYR